MAKSKGLPGDSALRGIPSVEKILSSASLANPIAEFGRERVKEAVVAHLATVRAARTPYDEDVAAAAVRDALNAATRPALRRVINATGIIIHTNLGRSPIDAALWARAGAIATSYSNLEFDLDSGERGARDEHLSALCRTIFGCEAAVLTNNNAAGTLLLLASVAAGKEVLVSRGELVEIGGAFRVPDVIQQGGAKLHEVGTTNRTRARDYAEAASRKTAAILKVHRSNFDIVGFTETPSIAELVEVARAKKLPLLYDEGSGRLVDLAKYGFARQETVAEAIEAGVDAVACSTDKLIGATQGGLILGRADLIAKCRRHPLMRALRAGKESYAIIGETLRAHATGKYEDEIPIYRMLATSLDALRKRAEALVRGTSARLVASDCALGGGTTPTETIPSIAVDLDGNANALHDAFLRRGIVGRIVDDRFRLDLRTVLEADLNDVADGIRAHAAPFVRPTSGLPS